MLDLLPPELIQIILNHVGLLYYDEYVGGEHFEDLSSLALVSKRLCSFAQPLVFAVLMLQVSSYDKLLKQYASNPRCRELVRHVRFIFCNYGPAPSEEDRVEAQGIIRTIVAEAKQLTEVLNDTIQTHPMSLFSGSTLKRLHLFAISFDELEDLALPELVELSIRDLERSSRGLQISQIPSLRHFAWNGPYQTSDLDGGIVSTLKKFDQQIDSLAFSISLVPGLKERIPGLSLSRTLVDLEIGSLNLLDTELYNRYQHEIEYLRIDYGFTPFQDEDWSHERTDLANLMDLIKRATPSSVLRTIYIATEQPLPHERPTQEAREARAELIQACRDCDIEVVLEDWPGCQIPCPRTSPDFVRRMKRRK